MFNKFLSFSYGSWVGLIIGFFGTMVTTRILMPEDFGKASMFTLALNISMIVIMLGTDQSFVRFFYEEKEGSRGGLLYSCLKISFSAATVAVILILAFHDKIALFLFEEENFTGIAVLAVGVLGQVLYRYATLVIRMQQKGSLFSLLEILNRTLGVASLLGLYFILGPSYKIIIYSTVISSIIITGFAILKEKKYWRINSVFSNKLIHSKRNILEFGAPLLLTMLIGWVFQSFDKVAIRHWSGLEELGMYAAAFKIVALVNVLQASFSTFWTPVAYERFEKDPEDKKFYEKMSKVVTVAMLFVAIMCIAGKDIVILLLGKNYRAAADIMPFLVFMPVMYTISETTGMGINFYKKPKWHVVIASVACAINVAGNWMLIPRFGAMGASVATAFAYIMFFTLKTQISLIYFKASYGLAQLYFMLAVISVYAAVSIFTTSYLNNVVAGFIALSILATVYKNEVREVYRFSRQKISTFTNS